MSNERCYDVQAYLKQFTPEQHLAAYIGMLRSYGNETIPMIQAGFTLAGPDGWKMVAPFWMKEFETEGIKPLEDFKNEPT